MAPKDVSGILSRPFLIGFYTPVLVGLVILWQALSRGSLPDEFEAYSLGTQLLILGAVSMPLGLILAAFNYPTVRLFEGYPLKEHSDRWPWAPSTTI